MKVLADENIPCAREAFAALGEVRLVAGRDLDRGAAKDAEVLFVRSVTRVDEELLAGSRVRFVGTATIGTDHLDLGYLGRAGIKWASADGSNANSVAEYVVCALLCLSERRRRPLAGLRLGVVGVGNVGRRVARYGRALGLSVLENDPPRARAEASGAFRPLEELLDADFLSLHVPLTDGADATRHLLDARRLAGLGRHTVLVNTARGSVVDNGALAGALSRRGLGGAVLDVFEGEPRPDPALIESADLSTPHIAGYSLDGKLAGTEAVLAAACRHFGLQPRWRADQALPEPDVPELVLPEDLAAEAAARRATRAVYDIERDDAALRTVLALPAGERGRAFDALRRDYPPRREFRATRVVGGSREARALLAALGFRA